MTEGTRERIAYTYLILTHALAPKYTRPHVEPTHPHDALQLFYVGTLIILYVLCHIHAEAGVLCTVDESPQNMGEGELLVQYLHFSDKLCDYNCVVSLTFLCYELYLRLIRVSSEKQEKRVITNRVSFIFIKGV